MRQSDRSIPIPKAVSAKRYSPYMRNLVQKTITDKNGVTSSRWVKPGTGGPDTMSMVPAPVISAGEKIETYRLTRIAAAAAYVGQIADPYDPDYDEFLEQSEEDFEGYSIEMLQEIAASDADSSYLKMFGLKHMIESDADTADMRDVLNLVHVLSNNDEFYEPEAAIKVIASLKKYPGVEPLNDAEGPYPELRKKQCEALLRVYDMTDQLIAEAHLGQESLPYDEELGTNLLANERLVDLVVNNPDDIDAILEFMEERGTDDVERIKESLYVGNRDIAAGIL
jgi:hypothetical protein